MPWWGIVLFGIGAWVLLSVVLGVVIGRAVKVAETHRRDEEFVRTLGRGTAAPPRTEAWPSLHPAVPSGPAAPLAPRRSATPQSGFARR
jgi:hypothetical protein